MSLQVWRLLCPKRLTLQDRLSLTLCACQKTPIQVVCYNQANFPWTIEDFSFLSALILSDWATNNSQSKHKLFFALLASVSTRSLCKKSDYTELWFGKFLHIWTYEPSLAFNIFRQFKIFFILRPGSIKQNTVLVSNSNEL